jgi:hypothetical protein
LDILTSLMIYTTVIVAVEYSLKQEYGAPVVGLVISNVLQLLVFLQWTVKMISEVKEKLASVRQVNHRYFSKNKIFIKF